MKRMNWIDPHYNTTNIPEISPLGNPRRRWVDNIRMDLGGIGCGGVGWIGLAWDRNRRRALVIAVLNLQVS
jgi:hypothetical protein